MYPFKSARLKKVASRRHILIKVSIERENNICNDVKYLSLSLFYDKSKMWFLKGLMKRLLSANAVIYRIW